MFEDIFLKCFGLLVNQSRKVIEPILRDVSLLLRSDHSYFGNFSLCQWSKVEKLRILLFDKVFESLHLIAHTLYLCHVYGVFCVFKSSDAQEAWKPVNEEGGTYFYQLSLLKPGAESRQEEYKGWIQIVK